MPTDDRFRGDSPDLEVAGEVTVKISRGQRMPPKGPTIPTLRVVAGRDMLKYATLAHEDQIIIGRDDTAELRLTDVTVSKRHARVITDQSGTIMVEDLQSTNGTSVNGKLDASNRDPLTRLLTRAFMDEDLPQLMERCARGSLPLSCTFIDVDRFKDVNDRFGHQIGDEVLVTIGRLVMLSVRDNDPAVRYGGEELLLFLPGSDEKGAVEVSERVRRAVASHDWDRTAPGLRVTASFGVAQINPDEDVKAWLKRADKAMYDAKRAGRNRVQRSSALGG